MQLFIPNSNVEAVILPQSGGYASLFMSQHDQGNGHNMASVNAGTSNAGYVFAVGLGGINLAIDRALTSSGQNTARYQAIHQALYDESGNDTTASKDGFTTTDPVQFVLMVKPDPAAALPKYDGIIFIDVFQKGQFPHQNQLNYGMVYVTPPNNQKYASNYANDSDFLKAVVVTSATVVAAVDLYNSKFANPGNANGLEIIETIRMCLFSGEIYRGGADQNDVAESNIKGLSSALAQGNSQIKTVEFEFTSAKNYLESR